MHKMRCQSHRRNCNDFQLQPSFAEDAQRYVSLSNHFACTVVAQPLVRSKNKNNHFLLAKTKTVLWSWKPTLRVGTLWAPHLTSKIDLFWPENILPKGKICGVTKKSGEIFSSYQFNPSIPGATYTLFYLWCRRALCVSSAIAVHIAA